MNLPFHQWAAELFIFLRLFSLFLVGEAKEA